MEITPIGYLETCFGEKFAVPRQPGLCPSAWGRLVFEKEWRDMDCLRGLEGFSHVWLIFSFHLTLDKGWSRTVRPPRLGGNSKIGVFGSRSTFRPNGLGLSLVRLESIELHAEHGPMIHLGGVDLVSGTPIYDIKPYLPYAEAPADATGGYAADAPHKFPVDGLELLSDLEERDRRIVEEALSLDPRPPAGRSEPGREFGALLCGHNVRFIVEEKRCRITGVEKAGNISHRDQAGRA